MHGGSDWMMRALNSPPLPPLGVLGKHSVLSGTSVERHLFIFDQRIVGPIINDVSWYDRVASRGRGVRVWSCEMEASDRFPFGCYIEEIEFEATDT